jgi:hypothetical protein
MLRFTVRDDGPGFTSQTDGAGAGAGGCVTQHVNRLGRRQDLYPVTTRAVRNAAEVLAGPARNCWHSSTRNDRRG